MSTIRHPIFTIQVRRKLEAGISPMSSCVDDRMSTNKLFLDVNFITLSSYLGVTLRTG